VAREYGIWVGDERHGHWWKCPSQKGFRDTWEGQWAVVETIEELFALLGVEIDA